MPEHADPEAKRERNRRYNEKRRSSPERSDAFYWSARWRRLRAQVLAEEPICRECKKRGITTPATQVDHIVPIREGGAPFDRDNCQGLCDGCHSRKTNRERAGRLAGP